MKQLPITIAALVLVGCGNPDDALVQAAYDGNIEAVKQHLAAGVDANSKDNKGRFPLHQAAYKGHRGIVELLIAKGADVNATNDEGGAPLHSAAWSGHKEIAELLIAKGADVNAKIQAGKFKDQTPLNWAIRRNEPETADLLRKHGAKTAEELKAEEK